MGGKVKPTNNFVRSMLTDLYQLTMAYGYWKSDKQDEEAVFDLFFRKNPFGGEFTISAGQTEIALFLQNFGFSAADTKYLSTGPMRQCEPDFFEWLRTLNCSKIRIAAAPEGTLVFPRIPIIRVEGPLAVAQLLETTLLNLTNYPSLIATNAARFKIAAGGKDCIEFGLRRAQGPDGGVSASRYSYIGGFDGTSNVLAGQLYGMPVKGTHAHAFVSSFISLKDLKNRKLADNDENCVEHDFVDAVLLVRETLGFVGTHEGELAAFIAYAQAFPDGFLALVDTYNTLESGVPNFICVALALAKFGYKPIGIRLDSGDLAYLSKKVREMFKKIGADHNVSFLAESVILASNDIDENILLSLSQQGHEVDVFGIGTHLVTCKAQPALGCVYKLVELNGQPRIKLSDDPEKMTVPGRKKVFRLIGEDGNYLLDLMTQESEPMPLQGERVLCRHPFNEAKRAYVVPKEVLFIQKILWDGKPSSGQPSIESARSHVINQLAKMRPDHLRFVNPTPYKVSVSEALYDSIHRLWMAEAPIIELK